MKKLLVKTSSHNYPIYIETGILKKLQNYIDGSKKILIISDDGVPLSYIMEVKSLFKNSYSYIIKQGESSKNIENYQKIMTFLVNQAFSRLDCIIALGGGVVGDLSGFIASTYLRGITFYNVPTTLLSQVDSSIGGKTAIDFLNIKNIIGSFYPPHGVFIDCNVLSSLPKRQLHAGLVEAMKMGLTFNAKLCEIILNSNDLLKDIETIVYEALLIKKNVVELDEKEANLRKVLNYGHTLGHVFEASSREVLIHGEAIGIGMLYFSSEKVKKVIFEFLNKYNLPSSYQFDINEVDYYLSHDKKNHHGTIDVIYVQEIGSYQIKKMNLTQIRRLLCETY